MCKYCQHWWWANLEDVSTMKRDNQRKDSTSSGTSTCSSCSDSDSECFMSSHTFALNDYVVIHKCDPPCAECEFIEISDKHALQLGLREERERNERYREKLTDLLKKYGRSLRQVEYQKKLIEKLTRQLYEERVNNINGRVTTEYTIIEPRLIEDCEKDMFLCEEHSDGCAESISVPWTQSF